MKHISVCIPTYEMRGKGAEFLRQSFDMLAQQTFKDFDVVISDHSEDDSVKDVCGEYAGKLDIAYFRNAEKRGNSSANINNAMRRATGKVIKVLFQDDFLRDGHSLGKIASLFDDRTKWLVTACTHTSDGRTFFRDFHPSYDDAKILFKNTVSSPSVLALSNDGHPEFDERLIWWMDTDFYKSCFARWGAPKVLDEVCAVNRVGDHQISSTLATERLRESEFRYILTKHHIPKARRLIIAYRLKRLKRAAKAIAKGILGKKKA